MQSLVPFADRAESPVDCLLHEVAVVLRFPLDQLQAIGEQLVAGLLVVDGQAREQREGGSLDELILAACPGRDLFPGVRRAIEEMKASGVANRPAIEIAAPAVHLS